MKIPQDNELYGITGSGTGNSIRSKAKLMEEQDLYKTEEEALAKVKEIGCVGTQTLPK